MRDHEKVQLSKYLTTLVRPILLYIAHIRNNVERGYWRRHGKT